MLEIDISVHEAGKLSLEPIGRFVEASEVTPVTALPLSPR